MLLTRLGPNDPALAGDLLESYRAGRSALWYWWQVLALVWSYTYGAVRPSLGWSTTAIIVSVLVMDVPFLIHSPAPADARLWLLMALYLAPQALVVAVPLGVTVGVVAGSPSRELVPNLRVPLIVGVFASLATFAMMGWLVPAANEAYRDAAISRETLRGASELTFVELHSLMGASESAVAALAPLSATWDVAVNYFGRLALSAAPIAFAIFGVRAATLAGMTRRLVVVTTACAYLAYFMTAPEWFRSFPPWVVAWLPTTGIVAMALLLRWLSSERIALRES